MAAISIPKECGQATITYIGVKDLYETDPPIILASDNVHLLTANARY